MTIKDKSTGGKNDSSSTATRTIRDTSLIDQIQHFNTFAVIVRMFDDPEGILMSLVDVAHEEIHSKPQQKFTLCGIVCDFRFSTACDHCGPD